MLVTMCLAPHPRTVCCTKKQAYTSVLDMIAKGSDMNVVFLPPWLRNACKHQSPYERVWYYYYYYYYSCYYYYYYCYSY